MVQQLAEIKAKFKSAKMSPVHNTSSDVPSSVRIIRTRCGQSLSVGGIYVSEVETTAQSRAFVLTQLNNSGTRTSCRAASNCCSRLNASDRCIGGAAPTLAPEPAD